ncbi:MAG: LysR family transcriptional regulator [Comamonadaceae bacterium]|nr:MAG: LysR family transcriptional regulator [Comamonadaceae bacterium]
MQSKNVKSPAPRPLAGIARHELPPLDLLRSFEAAARHLSFTQAAQELFLTQSAVSRQIQQIEASLGVPLFERLHRALELTEAGRVMQRAVVDTMERLRDATAHVRSLSALRQVSMTCTPGFASLWLIPRLVRFTAGHPQVDVRVSATLELLDLERSQVDLAVRFCPISQGDGAPLFEETLIPVCSPGLAANRGNPLKKPADLANHTLLAVDLPQGMALTADWEPWPQVMGLPALRMKNTVRFSSYSDAVAAAIEGQGVAIGRLPLMAELLRSKRLVTPFSGGAASQRGYYIMMSARGAANPDALDFARWLRAEAANARAAL